MAIISAGVVMNVLMAFICFIVVFRGPGKDQNAGVIGQVEAGSPAWKMGIPAGAQPHRIGDVEDPFFGDLLPVVMNSSPNEELDLVYSLPPSTKRIHLKIVARKLASDDRPVIGVAPAERCVLPPQRYYKGRRLPVYLQSAAARAEPPFEFDDEVIGCTDPEKRKPGDWKDDWTPLPEDPRNNQKFQPDFFELSRRLQLLIDEDVTIRVKRKKGSEVSIRVPRAYHSTFGVRMQMGQIAALRDGSPAAKKLKPAPPGDGKKKEGDIIEQVEVTEPSGNVTRFLFPRKDAVHPRQPGLEIDPSRLHFELRQWAARCDLGVKKNGKKIDKIVTLKVRRDNTDNGAQYIPTTARIKWDDNPVWKFTREVPYSLTSPTAIAELGIAFRITNIVNGVDPPTKRQGLRSGDVIKRFRLWVINKEGEEEQRSWQDLDRDQWPHIAWIMQTSTDVKKLTVQIDRDEEEIVLTAREDKTWPLADRGILFLPDLRVKRADNIGDAVLMGLQDTKKTIIQIYQNLQGMITGRISYKNLGGPVRIARFAYDIAGENFWDFVFFLGLIGINLAVVNFLPIPVLDGGHMVFLIYEKIRGKPASEQVRTVATIIGLLFIVSLFIFVTYLDISRIFR
jgi:regulator of sigma E protease